MEIKPVVVVLLPFYLPGYRGGGPIRTVSNMVEHMGDDFCFKIITSDRDFGDKKRYDNIASDTWVKVGKADVYYSSPEGLGFFGVLSILKELNFDVLYLNSFFALRFTIFPIFMRWLGLIPKRPVIVAPRGEFSEGALKFKFLKKVAFIKAVRFFGLYDEVVWHASTDFEASDIQKNLMADVDKIVVAQNLISLPGNWDRERIEPALVSEGLKVCFLSRISPKKNLDFALKVLLNTKCPVYFDIYGPIEDREYWVLCQDLIKKMPPHVVVEYKGEVENSFVRSVISNYHLFFFPTHGENFGHVFVESWAAGVPVLTSDQTPWRDLTRYRIGWDIPLDRNEEFSRVLSLFYSYSDDDFIEIRKSCLDYVAGVFGNKDVLNKNRVLFKSAIGV